MRELRFRAWSEESECYTCSANITEQVYANAVVHPEGTGQFVLDNDVDYIFEQYTGLKDKNGAEIYEGDVVHIGRCPINSKVYWDDVLACFMVSPTHVDSVPRQLNAFAWKEHNICEIVGNIHQNPELLE